MEEREELRESNKLIKTNSVRDADEIETVTKYIGTDLSYKHEIHWKTAIAVLILHAFAFWGLLLVLSEKVNFKTVLWSLFIGYMSSNVGVSAGAHRYYSHKSYKATPLLEVILIALQTIAGQQTVYTWSLYHRLHHRYSDTDADPFNSKRGIFFGYVGWVITKMHKYVIQLRNTIDMSDLEANKFVMFQERYYLPLYIVLSILIPVLVPIYFFNESWTHSLLVAYFLRYACQLNYFWTVVLLGHSIGTRPFDKNIQPVENWLLTVLSGGDGNHNFHHVFPWDYKTAEGHNAMSLFIDLFEKLGLAYDLKVASAETVRNRIMRTGDGTHHTLGTEEGKSRVKAVIGPLHPLNPTYTAIKDPEVVVRVVGPRSLFDDFEETDRRG